MNTKQIGLTFETLPDGRVKVLQDRLINGFILNQKQLIERGRELYPDAKIIPAVFCLDVGSIDVPWIEEKMKEFGIKRKDLIKQLAIDGSSLSHLIRQTRTIKADAGNILLLFLGL